MGVTSTAIDLKRQRDNQVAWKLLRSTNAPFVIAILDEHFGESHNRIPVLDFVNLVEADLEELSFRTDFDISKSAAAYAEDWRANGFLVRRPMAQTHMETYELSTGAAIGIEFAKQFFETRRMATQSRLSTVLEQIRSLALETNADENERRNALLEKRQEIDEKLEQLARGELTVIDDDEALEKARDIINLTYEIPTDFLRVRDEFEHINKSLHETIINNDAAASDILRDIFDGVDAIGQSPSGQSFRGFYQLLRDSENLEILHDDIDTILDSEYSQQLTLQERRFLRNIVTQMLERSQEVNGVMTSFARSLRRFVQNQSYQQDRALKREIDHALAKSHRVLQEYPSINAKTLGLNLELTTTPISPISRFTLNNPSDAILTPLVEFQQAESVEISFEELHEIARQTEIDFAELATSINETFRTSRQHAQDNNSVSVAQILDEHPATQGVASVVGLIVLAQQQGRETQDFERVRWKGLDGMWRHADIKKLEFYKEVEA